MSTRLKDKYRRRHTISKPGILGGRFDEVAQEKLLRVFVCDNFDINTTVYIEAKTIGCPNWKVLETLSTSNKEAIIDISLYDQIRYNVFTFGGTPATLEAVTSVDSDQNVIEKNVNSKDALRVLQTDPISGNSVKGYLNALVTMQFWTLTGADTSNIDFVIQEDGEPILDNEGNFVIIDITGFLI